MLLSCANIPQHTHTHTHTGYIQPSRHTQPRCLPIQTVGYNAETPWLNSRKQIDKNSNALC